MTADWTSVTVPPGDTKLGYVHTHIYPPDGPNDPGHPCRNSNTTLHSEAVSQVDKDNSISSQMTNYIINPTGINRLDPDMTTLTVGVTPFDLPTHGCIAY